MRERESERERERERESERVRERERDQCLQRFHESAQDKFELGMKRLMLANRIPDGSVVKICKNYVTAFPEQTCWCVIHKRLCPLAKNISRRSNQCACHSVYEFHPSLQSHRKAAKYFPQLEISRRNAICLSLEVTHLVSAWSSCVRS